MGNAHAACCDKLMGANDGVIGDSSSVKVVLKSRIGNGFFVVEKVEMAEDRWSCTDGTNQFSCTMVFQNKVDEWLKMLEIECAWHAAWQDDGVAIRENSLKRDGLP